MFQRDGFFLCFNFLLGLGSAGCFGSHGIVDSVDSAPSNDAGHLLDVQGSRDARTDSDEPACSTPNLSLRANVVFAQDLAFVGKTDRGSYQPQEPVKIYRSVANVWMPIGEIPSPEPTGMGTGYFGSWGAAMQVSSDAQTLMITGSLVSVRTAYLYTRRGDRFEGPNLVVSGPVLAMSADGRTLVSVYNGAGSNSDVRVRVYRASGSDWREAEAFAVPFGEGPSFATVSLSGDGSQILLAFPLAPGITSESPRGRILSFRYDGNRWLEQANLPVPENLSLSLGDMLSQDSSGQTAIASYLSQRSEDRRDGTTMNIAVYRRVGESWIPLATVEPIAGNQFPLVASIPNGIAVDLDGRWFAVGENRRSQVGPEEGEIAASRYAIQEGGVVLEARCGALDMVALSACMQAHQNALTWEESMGGVSCRR